MNFKICIFIFVISSFMAAQYLEYAPYPFNIFNEPPHAENKIYGIGNYGFNQNNNFFNPNYVNPKSKLYFSFSVDYKTNEKVIERDLSDKTESVYLNVDKNNLNYSFKYYFKNYALQANYQNTKLLHNKAGFASWFINVENYMINIGRPIFSINNSLLQIALISQVNGSFSLAGGIITNHYEYGITGTEYDRIINIYTNLFDNYQFMLSSNLKLNDMFKAYIYFYTQDSRVNLRPNEIKYLDDLSVQNDLEVSFPGLLAYGVQYKIRPRINLSFEVLHHFLLANEKIHNFLNEPNYFDEKHEHNIWNNEIVIGSHYKFSNNLEFGLSVSQYLKYDLEIKSKLENVKNYNTNGPYYVNISSTYKKDIFDISINFLSTYGSINWDKVSYSNDMSWPKENKYKNQILRVSCGLNIL